VFFLEIIKTLSFSLAIYKKGLSSAKRLALVLPGKLDTKDYPHMQGHVDFLASKGYLAVSFDPPGTWDSPGDSSIYNMTNYVKAINEVITYFGDKPTVLIGHSRGGSTAMFAGSRNKNVTHIIAIMSHVQSSPMRPESLAQGFQISTRDDPRGGERKFKLTKTYFEDPLQGAILGEISKCKKPKLFILGKKDITVKPAEVKEIYEKASPPKQLVEVDSDHNYRFSPEKIEEINKIIWNFLAS